MTTTSLPYPTIIEALKAAAAKLGQILGFNDDSKAVPQQIPPEFQLKTAKVPAKFASPGDVATRQVTLNIADLVRAGFFPRKHSLVQGDRIQSEVNGVYTEWKVNRKNARTAAAKFHPSLALPRIDTEGYHKHLDDIEVTGIDLVNP